MADEKIKEMQNTDNAGEAAETGEEGTSKTLYDRVNSVISVKYMMTCFGLMAAIYLFYLIGSIFVIQDFTYAGF